jgi:hypothetical protein
MMSDMLAQRRNELIQRCTDKVAKRPFRLATPLQLKSGIPLFLGQLQRTLEAEGLHQAMESLRISGPSGGAGLDTFEIGASAREHGRKLGELGYSVGQVVHDYGDLCQAITEMAMEDDSSVTVDEFRILNRCLDNAIAAAVTAFGVQQQDTQSRANNAASAERHSALLSELRNGVATASYAITAMEQGNLPAAGATGSVLKRALSGMRAKLEEVD